MRQQVSTGELFSMPPLNIHAHNLGIVCLVLCKVQRLSPSAQKNTHSCIRVVARGLSVRFCDQADDVH